MGRPRAGSDDAGMFPRGFARGSLYGFASSEEWFPFGCLLKQPGLPLDASPLNGETRDLCYTSREVGWAVGGAAGGDIYDGHQHLGGAGSPHLAAFENAGLWQRGRACTLHTKETGSSAQQAAGCFTD